MLTAPRMATRRTRSGSARCLRLLKLKRTSNSEVWLIGSVSDKIQGMKLPTSRQVLSVFFHQHKIVSQTIRDSCYT